MLVLELLGTLCLRNETGSVPVSAQQKRSLGLLAILALAGRQGFPRDRIETYLWPETSAPLARHSLDQTVYAIRHALGSDFILSTARELRLNPDLVQVDAWDFEQAVRSRQWAVAVECYKGALLDGFHFTSSRDLESWISTERARLREEYQTAVQFLANAAAESGDHSTSVMWWRKLANSDPLSSGTTKKLMLALAAAGDRAGAVKQARFYQELVRQELEIQPDSEIDDLAAVLSRPPTANGVASDKREASRPRPPIAENAAEVPPKLAAPLSVAAETKTEKKRSSRDRILLYAAIVLAVSMSGAAVWGWARPATSKPVVRYTMVVDSAEAIGKGGSWVGRMALSPDGSRLAYIGASGAQLWLRPRNELRATAVPASEGAATPFFSPDGTQVGFLRYNEIQVAPINGGRPTLVSDTLTGLSGASWGRDGFIYVDCFFGNSLLRVEAKPQAVPKWFTRLDSAAGEVDHTWPDVLPNGKGVLFTVTFNGRNGVIRGTSHAIAVANVATGKHRIILDDAMYPRYAASGHLLYVNANRTLMVVPFDQNSMKVTGVPSTLIEGMRLGLLGSADLAISATGTLVYATGSERGRKELVWVTRDGNAQAVDPDWQGAFLLFPTISPDGKSIAVSRSVNTESINIWIKRPDRGPSTRLTLGEENSVNSTWSPDGKSVTYTANVIGGIFDVWSKPADGSAPAVRLVHETRNLYGPRWSPDAKWLIFQTDPGQRGAGDIFGVRPGIDSAGVPLVASKFTEVAPALSSDGGWLAYASNETGEYEVYVVPFPNTGTAKWAISASGGTEPMWSHGGRELFYRDGAGNLVAVEVTTKPSFTVGRSTALFPAGGFGSYVYGPQYAVSPDDRRFLMQRAVATSAPDKIVVVENWFEELRAKSRK
jgi:DNA-binding SARP family transcriptional activator/Tol biopolymer transport system component